MFIENELANVQCGVFVLQKKSHSYPYAFSYNLISETSDQHIFFCFWQMKSLPDFH